MSFNTSIRDDEDVSTDAVIQDNNCDNCRSDDELDPESDQNEEFGCDDKV